MPKKIKRKWLTVEDKNVRHIWICTENGCKEKAIVKPEWYQNNGTPMCTECDCDMEYDHTEVLEIWRIKHVDCINQL